ncbi:MAG TPA: phosphosulfolactate synthase [Bacteroidia bacterium]|nr:phosphosulfolactate synthase [Bacteroidia bacterium]
MNLKLPFLPERTNRPRKNGVTMVMDKGLGLKQAEQFIDACADYVDLVKLGFGTSAITPNLSEKIKLYKDAGFKVYLGGTLFEAFIIRDKFEDYIRFIEKLKIDHAEVSDGSIVMDHDDKCEYIRKLSKNFTVLSEVGSKEEGIIIHPNKWTSMMMKELEAGSWKVIAEARESGNVGIYHRNGSPHTMLMNKIIAKVKPENILWEAPQKSQQVWFIKQFGANVNLGNIAFEEVIPLETLRLGLRGDTFFTFLPKEKQVE